MPREVNAERYTVITACYGAQVLILRDSDRRSVDLRGQDAARFVALLDTSRDDDALCDGFFGV